MNELIYLGAFALGMAFVWISGHVGLSIAATHPGLNYIVNFLISGAVYGLGAAMVVYFAAGRKLMRALLLGLAAAMIAPPLSYAIGRLAIGHVEGKTAFGLFTFGIYLLFGALYPALLAVARRWSRRRDFDAAAK